jgi:peroxiredoxin Q/BCP
MQSKYYFRRYDMAAKKLVPGAKAPDFTLPDSDEAMVSLKGMLGSWVVLYFYPKDSTPGCTTEAIDFTARAGEFRKLGAKIIGISPDSCSSHQKFMVKFDLGITLLSDSEKKALKQYGVWKIKKMYGNESYGVVRSTFLVDPAGKIRHIWNKVKVEGHVDEVLNMLKDVTH